MSQIRDAPAFDFYPERWLVGVATLSDAEQLSYLRLLCHQWLLQGLPEDVPALKRLGGKGVTPAVLAKLPLQADGKRRNPRLEIIREEQRERIAKKSEQRRAAAIKRWHAAPETPPANGLRTHGVSTLEKHPPGMRPHSGSLRETDAAGMRPHCGSICETDAGGMRKPCESPCENHAAGMPTPHHPPPTSHPVPEDANNAGAGAREAEAAVDAAAADAADEEAAARAASDAAADRAAAAEAAAERTASARQAADEANPSLATVQAWAVAIGCPPDKAEIWWHEHEARPLTVFGCWTDRDGNAVRRPQHALAAWWQKWQANDHQRNTRNHPPSTTSYHATNRPTPARSDSANAPGRYA
ncbi:MAG: hypothetical protein NTY98_03145 [Verrucomicrobia bacterium]|nr:hypothetical protein [Verrucomicrobiota bacterium]